MNKLLRISFFLGILILSLSGFTKPALVIIDVQEEFINRTGRQNIGENPMKTGRFLATQLELINLAKNRNLPIAIIEYRGYGPTSGLLQKSVANYPFAQTFKKDTDNPFDEANTYKPFLKKYFFEQGVDTLIISGANGNFCVRQTIAGALNENYSVVAVSEGIADFNYYIFIYPYANQYGNIASECSNCSFREVADTSDVAQILSANP